MVFVWRSIETRCVCHAAQTAYQDRRANRPIAQSQSECLCHRLFNHVCQQCKRYVDYNCLMSSYENTHWSLNSEEVGYQRNMVYCLGILLNNHESDALLYCLNPGWSISKYDPRHSAPVA